MLLLGLVTQRSRVRVSVTAGIEGGGEWMTSALFTLSAMTEVRPLSKAPDPQLLPGHRSINCCPLLLLCVHGVCVFTTLCWVCVCVCVHLDGLNAEHKFWVWDTIPGHTSRHFRFFPFFSPYCPLRQTWDDIAILTEMFHSHIDAITAAPQRRLVSF